MTDTPNTAYRVPLSLIGAYTITAKLISLDFLGIASAQQIGYIAGTADGIVTVQGKPARREILLMDANSREYQFAARVWSDDNGHYMFTNLDPDKQYLIMARDYNKEFEPFAYDYVQPATDLTPDEQQALRKSWQQ